MLNLTAWSRLGHWSRLAGQVAVRADCRQGQIISCRSLCEAVDFSSPFSFPRFVHGMCVGWGWGVWREGEKEQKFPGTDYVNTSKYSSVIINQKLENCEVL